MIRNGVLLAIVLAVQTVWACHAQTAGGILPVEEVRPGLEGIVLTVLEGTAPDTLPVEVIGVTQGRGPHTHLILVRGRGELARTGIAEGMSGSPVFIDGKLVGALAFAFSGSREPIGGVTPFAEMRAAIGSYLAEDAPRDPLGSKELKAGLRSDLPAFPEWRARCASDDPGVYGWGPESAPPKLAPPAGFSHIGVPVLIDGGHAVYGALEEVLQAAGLTALPSAAPTGVGTLPTAPGDSLTLAPGDALGVNLISGDLNAAAIGTVTWIEGAKIFAFGHPFMQGGRMEMPVSKVAIQTIIPTRSVSFKIGTPLQEVGALVADKLPGVGAIIGRRAARIPLEVTLRGGAGDLAEKRFSFEVARHELLTGALLSAAVGSALTTETFRLGLSMLAAEVAIELADGRTVRRRDLYRTLNPVQTIAAEVMSPVTYLIASTFATVPVRSVAVTLEHQAGLRALEIDRIRSDQGAVRPGEAFPINIHLRRHRGEPEVRRVTLQVPETTSAEQVVVMVGSARAFFEWDRDRAPEKYRPRSFDDLVRLIEEFPSDEALIVRLYAPSRGLVVRGRELSALPLSKWHTLSGGAAGGQSEVLGGVILDETILESGEVILGAASLGLAVEE
jgi:hypothetical protein